MAPAESRCCWNWRGCWDKNYRCNRELWLVFFDAEDNGNIPGWNDFSLGTTYYVDHLDTRLDYVIMLGMIGDNDLDIYIFAVVGFTI